MKYHQSAAHLVLAATLLVGCGRHASPAKPVAPEAAGDLGSGAKPAGPPSGVVPQTAPAAHLEIPGDATAQAVADQLTMELRRYVAYTRTIPKDFDDFAARHPMTFPAAPNGKHYAIESGKVVVR